MGSLLSLFWSGTSTEEIEESSSMNYMGSFARTPEEIVCYIFSFLDVASLASVAQVCSLWNRLSSQDFIWARFFIPLFFPNDSRIPQGMGIMKDLFRDFIQRGALLPHLSLEKSVGRVSIGGKPFCQSLKVDGERWAFLGGMVNTTEFLYKGVAEPPEISTEMLQHHGMSAEPILMDQQFLESVGVIFQPGMYHILHCFVHPTLLHKGDSTDPAEFFCRDQPHAHSHSYDPDNGELTKKAQKMPEVLTDYYRAYPSRPKEVYYEEDNTYDYTTDEVYMQSAAINHLIFPMQSTSNLDPERVAFYRRQMADGMIPTALALGRLDKRHVFFNPDEAKYQLSSTIHISLQCFLVDGHHKMFAAATMKETMGKQGRCSLLVFIQNSGEWPQGYGCDVKSQACQHAILENFSAIGCQPPPRETILSSPEHTGYLPTQPPFKISMCNMPMSPQREDIERYWTHPTHSGAIPCPIKAVEFPQDGKAGYVVVEFEDLETLKNAMSFCNRDTLFPDPDSPCGQRVITLVLAGSEWLDENGRCILATNVTAEHELRVRIMHAMSNVLKEKHVDL